MQTAKNFILSKNNTQRFVFFVIICYNIIMEFEIKLIEFLQAGRNTFFDTSFQVLSIVGSTLGVVALVLFFLVFDRKLLLTYLCSYGFVYLTVSWLKDLVARPRPFNASDTIANIGDIVYEFSFPSGHAACATAIAIFLGYFLIKRFKKPSTRACIVISCTIYIALVCLSRMYLGKHYLTDVLAGVAVSAIVCVLGLCILNTFIKKKRTKNYESKNYSK